jgi:ribosomal protein L39E
VARSKSASLKLRLYNVHRTSFRCPAEVFSRTEDGSGQERRTAARMFRRLCDAS